MSTKKIVLTVSLALALLLAAPALATTYYVKTDGSDDANGLSWATAFATIQKGINTASSGNEIWVKQGTYTLTSRINVNKAVTIEGGYTGNGSQRDWQNNITIVDGNDNVRCFRVAANGTIDGFTIQNGLASLVYVGEEDDYETYAGGGIYCDYGIYPTIKNCIITQNDANDFGGGIFIDSETSGTQITNCTISKNTANHSGGGIYFWDFGFATITDCTFVDNNAVSYDGGGLHVDTDSALTLTGCVFQENKAKMGEGGGIHSYNSNLTMKNCVFSDNDANNGGGFYNDNQLDYCNIINCTFSKNKAGDKGGGIYNNIYGPTLTNCIFWKNKPDQIYNTNGASPTVTYSDIEGGWTGTGNINANPNFIDPNDPNGPDNIWRTSDDGLHPIYSRCIDSANGNVEPSTDVCGASRFDHPDWSNTGIGSPDYVDMGAYESPVPAFVVLDSSGSAVALFDDSGNLYLKGTLDVNTTHTATAADEFRFQDSNSNDVGIIDANDGNMYIDGTLSENQGTLNPSAADDNFIIKDASGDVVAYIDDFGDLYLKGALYEQVLN